MLMDDYAKGRVIDEIKNFFMTSEKIGRIAGQIIEEEEKSEG